MYVPEERPLNNSNQKQSTTVTSLPSPTKIKEGDAFILLSDRRLSSGSSSPPFSPPENQSQENVGSEIWSMAKKPARPGRVQRLQSNPSTESEPSPKTSEDHLTTPTEDHSKQTKMAKKSLSVDETHHIR